MERWTQHAQSQLSDKVPADRMQKASGNPETAGLHVGLHMPVYFAGKKRSMDFIDDLDSFMVGAITSKWSLERTAEATNALIFVEVWICGAANPALHPRLALHGSQAAGPSMTSFD